MAQDSVVKEQLTEAMIRAGAELTRKKSYEMVQAALATTPAAERTVALSDVGVTDPKDPLIELLRVAVKTGPTVGGIRFTRNVINGHFIEDAYIYRMSDTAPNGQAT